MTIDNTVDAADVLGVNRTHHELRNMVCALSMCSVLNTPEENERLAAARFALSNWDAFQTRCNTMRSVKSRKRRRH